MARLLSAYEGSSFLVIEPDGDIEEGSESGLYREDTRFLSRYALRVGGARPVVLSSRSPAAHQAVVFATNPALPGVPRGSLVVKRSYKVGGGLHADLDIRSHAPAPVEIDVELAFDADFADVFEVKRLIESPTPFTVEPAQAGAFGQSILALSHASHQGWSRRTEVRFSAEPALDGRAARFRVTLDPGASFHVCQEILTIADGDFVVPTHHCSPLLVPGEQAPASAKAAAAPQDRPTLRSDEPALDEAFDRAIRDLYALRVRDEGGGHDAFHLAAGVPWYMALFGRDSLIAGYQALPYAPDLARAVLRSLARWQGRRDDPETEEQPGKILHEHRAEGLRGARSFVPRFPYYGTVDATPLFVVLLSAYVRRTGDLAFARAHEKHLAAAVAWITGPGDPDGDLLLEYCRSTAFGLWNQGWKDSEDSVRFRDGRQADPPIALVEPQGYAFDALLRAADLYRALGRPEAEAAALVSRAEALRDAIDRAYWLEDRGSFAMALDGRKQPVDALTSNAAHLLWSGAARPDRAARLAEALVGPDLFSGFGLRTMGASEAAYSPISYHNGLVWPHDTSLAAAGLARYGRTAEAMILAGALVDAVAHYDTRRLPELFAGFPRADTPFPVEYPTSNSPQAWAAGALLLAVTTMLGLDLVGPRAPHPPPAGAAGAPAHGADPGDPRGRGHLRRRASTGRRPGARRGARGACGVHDRYRGGVKPRASNPLPRIDTLRPTLPVEAHGIDDVEDHRRRHEDPERAQRAVERVGVGHGDHRAEELGQGDVERLAAHVAPSFEHGEERERHHHVDGKARVGAVRVAEVEDEGPFDGEGAEEGRREGRVKP
ncbi:MAG: glycogen debranching N-terminal domain-containing protein [Minicystis sp.]